MPYWTWTATQKCWIGFARLQFTDDDIRLENLTVAHESRSKTCSFRLAYKVVSSSSTTTQHDTMKVKQTICMTGRLRQVRNTLPWTSPNFDNFSVRQLTIFTMLVVEQRDSRTKCLDAPCLCVMRSMWQWKWMQLDNTNNYQNSYPKQHDCVLLICLLRVP